MRFLDSLFSLYPELRLARFEDNERILRFIHESTMSSNGLAIGYDRGRDFFAFQRLQAPQHFNLLLQENGNICGMASLVVRQGYIDGHVRNVAFLGDLRMDRNRGDPKLWYRVHKSIVKGLEELEDDGQSTPVHCAVLAGNSRALSSLTRPGSPGPQYAPLASYQIVNLLFRMPRWWRSLSKISRLAKKLVVHRARSKDVAELKSFLDADQRRLPFGYCFAHGELERRLADWPGFGPESFFIVRDRAGRLLGTTALWSPGEAKQIILGGLPRGMGTLCRALSAVKPRARVPKAHEPFRTLYLTHLAVDSTLEREQRLAAFQALVEAVYSEAILGREKPAPHCLAFADFSADQFCDALPHFVKYKTPALILCPESIHLPPSGRVGFEMALV